MSFLDKVLDFIGVQPIEEDDQEAQVAAPDRTGVQDFTAGVPRSGSQKKTQLVSLPGQKQMRVVVVEPTSIEGTQAVADHLKSRRPVVVCLDDADKEVTRRIVDFCSGAVYALDGSMQKLGEGIYLFAPSNVSIESEPVRYPEGPGNRE